MLYSPIVIFYKASWYVITPKVHLELLRDVSQHLKRCLSVSIVGSLCPETATLQHWRGKTVTIQRCFSNVVLVVPWWSGTCWSLDSALRKFSSTLTGNWHNSEMMQGQCEDEFQTCCMFLPGNIQIIPPYYFLHLTRKLKLPAALAVGKNEDNSFVNMSPTYFRITCRVATSSRLISLVREWKQFYCR